MADIKIAGRIKAGAADGISGYASEILFDDAASNKTVKEKIEEVASSPQTMIVTISPDGNDGYEADKTFAEIKAFIDNGGTVIAKDEEDGDSYYYLDNYIASEVVFTRNIWGSGGFSTRYYTIDNTNTVSFIDSVHHISSAVNSSSTTDIANSAAVKALHDSMSEIKSISVNNTEQQVDQEGNVDIAVPDSLAELSDDTTHRTVTDAEKTTWNGKQNALTFDNVPTANSNNPVKSGGVYQAIQDIDVSSQISGKADKSEMSVVAGTGANADKTTITLKSGTSATVLTQHQDISGKEDKSNKVTSFSSPTDTQYPSAKLVNDQLATKQGTISDLSTIRSGASAGATAYQKPGTGIPPTDLASAVQTSLGKADTAIQSVTVGTTTTGAAGSSASVTNTGTATEPVLSFTIPQGAQGIQGIQGPQGERGPQGNTGVQVDSVASIIHSIDPTATYAADDVAGADAVQDVLAEVTELEGNLYEKKADNTISSSTYTFTASKYISLSNGNVVSGSSSWNCTEDYIPIDNWLSVYTTATGGSSGAAVAFYKADKTYISGAPCGTTATIQVPTDAAYARFSKLTGSHTITTYILTNKIDSINDAIDAIESDLETNYQQKNKEIDYLPNVVQGIGYKSNGIGTTIVTNSNSAFYSAKIPCKKGDMFGIITNGFANALPAIITDADNIVLWSTGSMNHITVGGVLEIAQDNAAYLYVSSYNTTITKLTKLVTNPEDTVEVDSSYAKSGMLGTTNSIASYSGYAGFGIPLLLRKGDVVKVKFKSYNNYRGYLLRDSSNTLVGSLSDTDLLAETLFCWNGDENVYLYVNGLSSDPPHIIRYSRNVAKAMKNYGKKIVALGDSITSYDSCDFGELVRGHLGVSFLKTSTQIDWGNIAEGNATICNWENTTDTCQHNSAIVDGTYVNRTLPNQVLQLLQHVTAEGEQITWHISSNNSDHSLATSVGVGAGYTTDIPDIIYIAMGTNDVVTTDDFSTVIAQSYSQLTKLTICSALRWSIETLQNKFPNAVIICVTPIVRTQRPTAEMEAKCELIKKMCAYMAIPVVDGYHISGFSPLSQKIYSSDYIHPNSYTQRIARSIAAQVDALC